MSKKLTTEEFIAKAKSVHGDKYNYSKVNYINKSSKVCIICQEHGEFYQTPDNHINSKNGCPYCSGKHKYTTEEFIAKAKSIHGDKYDYSNSNYQGKNIKVLIKCNTCNNQFYQTPDNHINSKNGCPYCSGNIKITTEEFIRRAKSVHGDKYSYEYANYVNSSTPVIIVCNLCGIKFTQTPHHHLSGQGCPNCSKSKGEERIRLFLERNNIDFEQEKRYKNCRDKRTLPFDFYLPKYNLLIEYQGDQHFRSYGKFGGTEKLKKQQYHDNLKREFCSKTENPNLLEITYKEYNSIEKKLTEFLKNNNISS